MISGNIENCQWEGWRAVVASGAALRPLMAVILLGNC